MKFHHSTSNGTPHLRGGIVHTKLVISLIFTFYALISDDVYLRMSLLWDDWPRLIAFINRELSRKRQSRERALLFRSIRKNNARYFHMKDPLRRFHLRRVTMLTFEHVKILILSKEKRSFLVFFYDFVLLECNLGFNKIAYCDNIIPFDFTFQFLYLIYSTININFSSRFHYNICTYS